MTDSITPPSAPLISVVVATYQRRAVLEQTLPTILAQDPPPGGFEVVIVVDGSNDGTELMLAERFQDARLRVIRMENSGPAAARNVGIAAATGRVVLLLDDDMFCAKGLLQAHAAAHARLPRCAAFGPIVGIAGRSTAAEFVRQALGKYYTQVREEWNPSTTATVFAAPNTSVPRDDLVRAGGFDVRFARAYEDVDLGLRLRARGLDFIYVPDAEVSQLYTKRAQDLVAHDAKEHGAGEILLCRVHPQMRRQSFLRSLAEGWAPSRIARAALARSPIAPDLLLRPIFALLEALPRRWVSASRMWLLTRRGYVARLRAATAAAGGWSQIRTEFGRRVPTLTYHHVGPRHTDVPASLSITPERFSDQMHALRRRGFNAITARRWCEWLEYGTPLPEKPFVLTFDDGYADLAEHAFPVLQQLGFTATVFVVTDLIGGTNDWDRERGIASLGLLDRDQIQEWADRGIEFGSHSRTHRALDSLPADELDEELRGSRTALEAVTGKPVRAFAYPYGITTPHVIAAAGLEYAIAFGGAEGINTLATPAHEQRRSMVQLADTSFDVALRAQYGASPLTTLRAALRLRSHVRALVGKLPL